MGLIKNIFGAAGSFAGDAIGGTVAWAGEKADSKLIKDIGNCARDATTRTGCIFGEVAEGAVSVIKGSINSNPAEVELGAERLGNAASDVLKGACHGIAYVAGETKDLAMGIADGNHEKAKSAAGNLLKVGVVSALAISVFECIDGVEDVSVASAHDLFVADLHHDVASEVDSAASEHYVHPHHVDDYVRHDGTEVHGYWRDGDGNSLVNLAAKDGGGYFRKG